MADTFTVTGQVPATDIGPTGTVVPTIKVTFSTKPHNIVGFVNIPVSAYTAEEVAKVVGAHAAALERVQAL